VQPVRHMCCPGRLAPHKALQPPASECAQRHCTYPPGGGEGGDSLALQDAPKSAQEDGSEPPTAQEWGRRMRGLYPGSVPSGVPERRISLHY
jgi:hypothetical protein